jgi:NADPH-ferrihemoprotein reductase
MTFAAIMTKEAKAQGLNARLSDLEMVQLSDLDPEETLLLVMATYGEGEPTDNAADFFEELHHKDASLPENLHYAVFGLGNSATYPDRFNVVSKAVDERLAKLKGTPVLPLRLGDSASTTSRCVDDDFDEWKEEIWATLRHGQASDEHSKTPDQHHASPSSPSTLGLALKHYSEDEQAEWHRCHP